MSARGHGLPCQVTDRSGSFSPDCMSFPQEATHPRYYGEGYPDWPGRASNKEGESWTSIAGLSSESIRQSCAMRLRSRRMVVTGRSLSWRDRHHGSGDAQARRQACGQIPSTDVLLRGGADGIRALSADQEAWPRLHRGGAFADPEETWRSGGDEPSRWGRPSQAIARL